MPMHGQIPCNVLPLEHLLMEPESLYATINCNTQCYLFAGKEKVTKGGEDNQGLETTR